MTKLEQETFTDGFRVCLLGVRVDRGRNLMQYAARLYDGGRLVGSVAREDWFFNALARTFDDLRQVLIKVAAPPHVLAVHGSGWNDVVTQIFPEGSSPEPRVLELLPTARALIPLLRRSAPVEEIARAYGIAAAGPEEGVEAPAYEHLLWAVVGRAGEAGMTWPELLRAKDAAHAPVSFDRYLFGPDSLASLPAAPGVYVMLAEGGETLYVGKSADLKRRLSEYFRGADALPPKLQAVREQIRNFEIHPAGSELEALLMENRLITERRPTLNVQRQIAAGADTRHAAPILPTAILAPSVSARSVELFLFGSRQRALQCRIRVGRPPRKRLEQLLERFCADTPRFRKPSGVKDWGAEGNEICCRYWARFRNQLQWVEVNLLHGVDAFVDELLRIADLLVAENPAPGEFRLGE